MDNLKFGFTSGYSILRIDSRDLEAAIRGPLHPPSHPRSSDNQGTKESERVFVVKEHLYPSFFPPSTINGVIVPRITFDKHQACRIINLGLSAGWR